MYESYSGQMVTQVITTSTGPQEAAFTPTHPLPYSRYHWKTAQPIGLNLELLQIVCVLWGGKWEDS